MSEYQYVEFVAVDRPLSKQEIAEREKAALRQLHLDRLAARGDGAWREVDGYIAEKNAKSYDEAAKLMVDLRDVARRPDGDVASFKRTLDSRLSEHRRRSSFMSAVRHAGLTD